MLLSLDAKDFIKTNIILSDKTKNNVLHKGDFYRIYYSNQASIVNGLYVHFVLQDISIEPYFNKIKCNFNPEINRDIIKILKNIEKEILLSLSFETNIKPVYRIEEQLQNDFIKIFADKPIIASSKNFGDILLKISGIWSNEQEYGITFRFFFIHQLDMM